MNNITIDSVLPASYVSKAYGVNKAAAGVAQPPKITSRDEAEISQEALSFSKTFAAAKNAIVQKDSGEQGRIDEVRAQVQSGTYNVDPRFVADALISRLGL
ncbi:MAG: flagellar biosynthesis anti-sigma factor FlgM [Oscillospiraceae bacterium]|jgi:flagellar biosynthesis anti-sigma factor FlgM|nr:flagellar biosynthesis anti-sigma factor FlgM [Oscillospiraceae bacterium]